MIHTVFRHESCGSVLTIDILSENDPAPVVKDCFLVCDTFEERYSRFKPGNRLDVVNSIHEEPIALDDESYGLVTSLLAIAKLTEGAFDPTIIRKLEAYGYDSTYSFKRTVSGPTGYQHVELSDHSMILHHDVKIEFGAIGKGYLVDLIADVLTSVGYNHFLIDFGGDIKARGSYKIGLENPFDLSKLIGTITVDNFAVAASNGMKRKVGDFHHLLNGHSGEPVRDIAGVYISSQSCMVADLYSTAVFVSGAEKGKQLLAAADEISGLIVFSDGTYRMKQGYQGELFV